MAATRWRYCCCQNSALVLKTIYTSKNGNNVLSILWLQIRCHVFCKKSKISRKTAAEVEMWHKKCCRFLAMMSAPRHASATFWRTLCRRILASFAVPTFGRGARRCMIRQLRGHMTMALLISRATRWRHLCLRVRTSAYLYAPA